MINSTFEELERRCKNINRKRYLRWFFIIFALLAIFVVIYIEFFTSKSITTQRDMKQSKKSLLEKPKKTKSIAKLEKIREKPKQILKKSSVVKKNEVKKIIKKIVKKQKRKAEPRENKKVMQKKSITYDTIFLNSNIVVPKTIKAKKLKKETQKTTLKKRSILQNSTNTKKKKIVIKVKSFKDEESLLKDSRVDENFETTLKLSSYYLKKLKYQKAVYWSKKASRHRPSSFEPWLIYAKAKIKQHKKPEAIRAVKTFLSYFDSKDARKFLMKIEGK